MREDTVTTKVYTFDELDDDAKQTAIERLYSLNVDYEWWEFTYDDAAMIGLVITEHSLQRGAYVRGTWTEDAEDTARLILEHHGESDETYQDATEFLAEYETAEIAYQAVPDGPEYGEFEETDEYDELCEAFQRTICEDYRILLQHEYEYQTSEESIIETIEANEYEFTEDGKLY